MKLRITCVLMAGLFLAACGSSQSVYQLPESQQKGLTYQTYQASADEAFEAVDNMFENQLGGLLGGGWDVATADRQRQMVETEWRVVGRSQDAHEEEFQEDERVKIVASITEESSGSRITFRLKKQKIVVGRPDGEDPWRDWTVKKSDAKTYVQPLLKELDEELN